MWIFMNDAMLSIVEHRGKPDHLLVRGRIKGDIERVFPDVCAKYTPLSDYGYRADVHRDAVSSVLKTKIENISYDNFKSSVSEPDRSDAYYGVWDCMYKEQHRRWELMDEEV